MPRLAFLLLASALLGCSNRNFNTPQLLDQPRILAIQAEPPQPKQGQSTTLQALVYLPPGSAAPSYSWSWCPLRTSGSNGYACPIQESEFVSFFAALAAAHPELGMGTPPSFDLGTGTTAMLTNPFPAPLLAQICLNPFGVLGGTADAGTRTADPDAGNNATVTDCLDVGYPITVYLTVAGTPVGSLQAVFEVKLPTDDTIASNQNPVVGRVQATWGNAPDGGPLPDGAAPTADSGGQTESDGGGAAIDADGVTLDAGESLDGSSPLSDAAPVVGPLDPTQGVELDDAFSTLLPRQVRIKLHLELPKDSSEPLSAAQAAVDPNHRISERLDLAWFAEAGDFGNDGEGGHRTGFLGFPEDADSPFLGAIDNKWTLPKSEDHAGSTSRLIVVVRDDRGGVGWTTGSASLEPTP